MIVNGLATTQGDAICNHYMPRQNGRHFPDDIFKCIFFYIWCQLRWVQDVLHVLQQFWRQMQVFTSFFICFYWTLCYMELFRMRGWYLLLSVLYLKWLLVSEYCIIAHHCLVCLYGCQARCQRVRSRSTDPWSQTGEAAKKPVTLGCTWPVEPWQPTHPWRSWGWNRRHHGMISSTPIEH